MPTQAELDAGTLAWVNHSPESAPAAIARANDLLQRADALYRAQKWPAGDVVTQEARRLLLQVHAASQADPNWHAAWLDIARLQGWDPRQIMDAVEAAADAEPGAAGPWHKAVAALSPDGQGAGLLVPLAELAAQVEGDRGLGRVRQDLPPRGPHVPGRAPRSIRDGRRGVAEDQPGPHRPLYTL